MPLKSRFRLSMWLAAAISFCPSAPCQELSNGYVVHPDQEVQISSLPSVIASSKSDSDVMVASLATAVMDSAVCCGRNSALQDEVPSDGTSLKELGYKLRGKHRLSSGESFNITDQYWTGASVNPPAIIGSLIAQRALIMDWNDHLYVVHGAVFDEYRYYDGRIAWVIKKLLLVDTRYSDKRRYASFDRQADDWGKVTGILALTITR